MPTVAAHLTGPWNRVIVVPGTGYSPWQSEDVYLALDVAARLVARSGGALPLVVIADDEQRVRDHVDARLDYEFIHGDKPGEEMLAMLTPKDLIVAPSYVLPQMPIHRRVRLSLALADQNLAIVAAAGRFAVMGSRPRPMERFLGQHS